MTVKPMSMADTLARLVEQRRANQISEWEFESKKRDALQLLPSGLPPIISNLIVGLVVNCICLGLALAFPTQAKILLVMICLAFAVLLAIFMRKASALGLLRGRYWQKTSRERLESKLFGRRWW